MNNSRATLDEEPVIDRAPELRQMATELATMIDAVDHIRASNYWKIIQRRFGEELTKLINQLESENDPIKLYRLQGQIRQARRLDLDRTAASYRKQLDDVQTQLRTYERT